ncbi:iron-siderophore ABC transporter substrate-binding protein [Myxacorys almedinensis]|uniref:ABC transporter substrate-binding protein n=1 Tax=Myxacorys almedinensis A TaxID=2690445 RepID=A0A8J8CKF5_9CYAN|nr:iron-siderophore ABC transporter substrate-binding protein [Myxacorys almedinensis]NDJ19833.1 ABC transporter substrate-binding protein [Myxacorys almedinensis A]
MKTSLRHLYLLLLAILASTLLWACSRNVDNNSTSLNHPTEDCRVVQHQMGETCIPRNPQRVATLWMSTFSSALALGIKPIANIWIPGQPLPGYLRDKTDEVEFVGSLGEPNLEKILRLKPDLILSNSRMQNMYDQLTYIAPTVVLEYYDPPPWQKHLKDVAKVLDKEQESSQLIKDYWRKVEQVKQAMNDCCRNIQVSVVRFYPGHGLSLYGNESPVGKVIRDIGLKRPPSQDGDFEGLGNLSLEQLPEIDGDVLFLVALKGESTQKTLETLQRHPLWQNLKAVQQHRVYFVDFSHWYAFDVLAMNAVLDDLEKYLINTP